MDLDWQLNIDTFADTLDVGPRPLLGNDHGRGHCQGSGRPSGDMQRSRPATVSFWYNAVAVIGTAERKVFGMQGKRQVGRW